MALSQKNTRNKKILTFYILGENILKNLVALFVAAIFYAGLRASLTSTLTESNVGDFLVLLSILLVSVCFANFAFSYEYLATTSGWIRVLSHGLTFLMMLLIVQLLIAGILAIQVVYPPLYSITVYFSIVLYAAIMLYDFWDLLRGFKVT